MRADRLLSIMMLLQARGRVTAAELAEELEVSERTIYRDIDALSAAGVPLYGEPGAGGGYALVDEYRTKLTGLTEPEVRALFMATIAEPLAPLGADRQLKSALRKLSAALPDEHRPVEDRVRQRFLIDATSWGRSSEALPYIQVIHGCVWRDHRLRIAYRTPFAGEIEQVIEPYGIVAKAGEWYVVYGGAGTPRVIGAASVVDVHDTGETFERLPDFSLREFWAVWCREREATRHQYSVRVTVVPEALPYLRRRMGGRIGGDTPEYDSTDVRGRLALDLTFESLYEAREVLLGFGGAVEVLEPEALRRSLVDFAERIVELYAR